MKLHLGCGKRHLDGYINCDCRADVGADVVLDVTDLSQYMDGCADLIYACHVLEHVPRNKTIDVLKAWRRVLRPGGTLRISVPDFRVIAKLYTAQHVPFWRLVGALVGRQDYPENTHYNIFDYDYLAWHLEQAGFHSCHAWYPIGTLPRDYDDYSLAMTDGQGISLNLECVRA